jgi:anhydro-N-acetylmuramic acid kinase
MRALAGQIDHDLAHEFIDNAYFCTRPPKSTDTPAMIALYEKARTLAKGAPAMSVNDELATASFITAHTIAKGWRDILRVEPDEVVASGGGVDNAAIMEKLSARCRIVRSDDVDVPSQSKEALAFALLGAATLDGLPSNVPSVTGARRAVVLGSITPRP